MANSNKNTALQLGLEELESFQVTSAEYVARADCIIKDCYLGYIQKNEELLTELFGLYYNSKSFGSYCKKIRDIKLPDDKGYILLKPQELKNITTYLLAMLKSKQTLLEFGVDISEQ